MKKISIIMPSYNDAKSIVETLDSVMCQTYENWELVIVNDGSTDDTENVILDYKKKFDTENKIKYIYQENGDQLNAILNGSKYLNGDYISVLHSDDLLNETNALEKVVKYLDDNSDLDAIIADLVIIDENSRYTGIQKVKKYKKANYILPLQTLWLGRNLFIDVAIHTRDSFFNNVIPNYVMWNTPFWINFNSENGINTLNVEKVNFQFYKYRIHSQNYEHSENGQLNIINGELRTFAGLSKYYDIPFYKIQYLIFRTFNKLKLNSLYRPIYKLRELQNKGDIIEFIIQKRFGQEYVKNRFLKVLVDFYKTPRERKIVLTQKINDDVVWTGKDNAKFNKALKNNTLDKIYIFLFNEMEQGFNKIYVINEQEKEKVEKLCRFLCIYQYVEVIVNKGE